jgi:tetratricopeptide (TPR) repeat protein
MIKIKPPSCTPQRKLLARLMLATTLCVSVSFVSITVSTDVYAAKKESARKKNKAPLIRKKIYDKLTKAQEFVSAKKYAEAKKILDQINDGRRLNNTERIQLWNFYAYIAFSQDNYPEAIKAYSKMLSLPELQLGIRTSTIYTLSQLYFLTENYPKALENIKKWIKLSETPSPDAYALLGQAYYKLKQFKDAIPALKKAIELRKASGKPIKENWYLLLRATYYELKDYKSMVVVLKELVTLFPKAQYFRDLAGSYSQLGDTKNQLGIMEAMYEKGQLTKGSQIRNLSSLYLIHGIPYKAAKALDAAIKQGLLEKTEKNLRLISQAWVQAREDAKAIAPLTEAAKISSTGETWVNLGQAYINLDKWPEAIKAIEKGLKVNGVKKPDSTYILLGMGYYNLKQMQKARSAFKQALAVSKSKHNKASARQWIKYLDTEIKRESALAKK